MMAKKKITAKPAQSEQTTITQTDKSRDRIDQANKFTFEIAKHITTLDSGIIVVFATLNSNWITSQNVSSSIDLILLLLGLATIAAFLFSTIACVFVMFLIPYQITEEKIASGQEIRTDIYLAFGLTLFIVGILLIIAIAAINLIY